MNNWDEQSDKTVTKFYENQKPVYGLRAEFTTDDRVAFWFGGLVNKNAHYWAKAYGERIEGDQVVMYVDAPQLTRKQILRLCKVALERHGVIGKSVSES